MIGTPLISTTHQDYNDGIPLVSDWVNPVSCNDFLIKYNLLLIDGVTFGEEGSVGNNMGVIQHILLSRVTNIRFY